MEGEVYRGQNCWNLVTGSKWGRGTGDCTEKASHVSGLAPLLMLWGTRIIHRAFLPCGTGGDVGN